MNTALEQNLIDLGFDVLSEFERAPDLVTVRCQACGDTFTASYGNIRSGKRLCECRRAANRRAKFMKNLLDLQEIAGSRGGKVLTLEPLSSHSKWTFQCSENHVWSSQGDSVKGGTWCPVCSGNTPRSLTDLQDVVHARGGQLLSTEYKGVDATYTFTCSLGHEFQNMFKKVEGGQWCPTCNKGSKSEEVARVTFESLFGMPFKKVRPKWLRNSRGRIMELDGYCEELKIGFEYQGIQHFEDIGLYSTDVSQRIADDELKFKLCQEQGISLFYLTYLDDYEDYPIRIKEQAIKFGLDIAGVDFEKKIDLASAYIRDDRLPELRALLAAKDIRVLSTKWLTSDTKYSLECLACGHTWSAQGNMFFNSRRVAGCQVCAWANVAKKNSGDLDVLKAFAHEHGGECLSTEYRKRSWDYGWRCSQGHEFTGNFNNMKHRNQFCPRCEGRANRLKVEPSVVVALFEQMGLELIDQPAGRRTWLRAKCLTCGKTIRQQYANLENGMPPCTKCSSTG